MPDVMHSHGYLPDVIVASMSRALPFVRVSTVHGFTGGSLRNRVYELSQRVAFRRFDAVVAVSRKLARELGSRSGNRVHALPNAWAPRGQALDREAARQRLGLPSGVFAIGWVGRISHEKGLDVLIDALPSLSDLGVHAGVIGDGADRKTLELRSNDSGLGARVTWCGEVESAWRLLPAFDVLVISSRTEGTPIILFEAMDAGVAIVTTAVGGVPDVVSAAEAILIQPEDPAALASGIRQVHDAPAAASARAMNARERLGRDFGATSWLESYDEIYRNASARRLGR
jgi:glycosyltransferase involved in cell wall biosynthesis